MANEIVIINTSVTNPPAPNTLQRTGAFISQGATTLTEGTTGLLTQLSDLTSILTGAKALTSLTWASSVATATTTTAHGFTNGDTIPLTIAGAAPTGYNGTFECTITGASTFTYPLTANPGSETVPGTYTPEDVSELVADATTFFAQGSGVSVYVLELGAGTPAEGVTALSAYMAANPKAFYADLVPEAWAAEPTFITFAKTFTNPNSMQYFHITATDATYSTMANVKSIFAWIQAPAGVPATEVSAAADFYVTLNYSPSSTNKVPPNSFAFLFGVTPYPVTGTGVAAKLAAYKAAGVNVVGTGANGGLSNMIVYWGTYMDVNPFNYWYSIDWTQINLALAITNEIINGSNNPINPLYYDQPGINRLQGRGAATLSQGISFGLILGQLVQTAMAQADFIAAFNAGQFAGQAVINCEPFVSYVAENPDDFPVGKYGGISAVITPARGFEQVIFNLNATQFA